MKDISSEEMLAKLKKQERRIIESEDRCRGVLT